MNKYLPKVSIVIPAYNASNYLAVAIDSALNQTYRNIEVIVVNDGSKDAGATAEVAKRYGDKIRYFEKENGGSSSAMNFGIKMMTGDWFSWLSHDDAYYPTKVQEEIDALNKLNIDFTDENALQRHIFFAAVDIIDARGNYIKKSSAKKLAQTDRKINRGENFKEASLALIADPVQNGFYGCSCLIHRRALAKMGGFDEKLRLLNDMEMWFKFYSNDYTIHFIPKALVLERIHSSQISRSIGYSYHNAEQDAFWSRNLKWLSDNYPDRYDLFYLFGKTAFLKTRFVEGEAAFVIAGNIKKNRKLFLAFVKQYCKALGLLKELAKRVLFHK